MYAQRNIPNIKLFGKEQPNMLYEFFEICLQQPNVLQADPALVDVINLTAVAIRRLIKMAKKINAFKNMCQEDQVALLKGGCTEMMILRSAMNFDLTKQTWKVSKQEFLKEICIKLYCLKSKKVLYLKEVENKQHLLV